MRTIFVLKKHFFPFWLCKFFGNIFTPTPDSVCNWSSLGNNIQLYQKHLQICYKKRLKTKKFSWSYQRNTIPSTKPFRQTPFFQILTQSKSSESFLRKLKTITTALNIIFFTITWRATSMDKSILTNIVGCNQNRNPSQIFL